MTQLGTYTVEKKPYVYSYEESNGNYTIKRQGTAPGSQIETLGTVTPDQLKNTSDFDNRTLPGTASKGVEKDFREKIGLQKPQPSNNHHTPKDFNFTPGLKEINLSQVLGGLLGDKGAATATLLLSPENPKNKGEESKREVNADQLLSDVKGKNKEEATQFVGDRLILKGAFNAQHGKPPVSPMETYDNLVANGVIKPENIEMENGEKVDKNRPKPEDKWPAGNDPKKLKEFTKDWHFAGDFKNINAKDLAASPLFSKTNLTQDGVRADTQRKNYVDEARKEYVEWAKANLGLEEGPANALFNERATQLHVLKRTKSGGYEINNDWNPNNESPFFASGKEGESIFNEEGTLKTGLKFNSDVGDPATNPVAKAAQDSKLVDGSRDILFATMTGELPEGSKLKIQKSGDKTFVVSPTGEKTEIKVLNPPLSKTRAIAFMQSKGLTDADGNPLPGVSSSSFIGVMGPITSGELGTDQLNYNLAAWERQETVKVLSAPPYSMKDREIVRFMNSNGWLGDSPNIDSMEDFRKNALKSSESPEKVEAIKKQVKAADIEGNDPLGQVEQDRAAQILDTMDKSGTRGGRESGREEGRANRDTQWRIAKLQEDGKAREGRLQREHDRLMKAEDRDFQTKMKEMDLKHDSEEKAKDRDNQMMMSLIQFLGSMITGAMQALAQVDSAIISGQGQFGAQIVGGMRGGR